MNRYSKMRLSNKKTRSVDFSDLLSSPPTQETNENTTPNYITCGDEPAKAEAVVKNTKHHHDKEEKKEKEEEDASRRSAIVGGVKLSRTCSVAHASSPRFRLERQSSRRTTGVLQSAVTRVFSMRRSSSVSERYCRIYDQHVPLEPAFDDDDGSDDAEGTDNNATKTRSTRNKKKSGILKACRRLLGF